MKHIPTEGERLYTYTPCSDMWVSDVRDPWTVESVNGNTCVIRAARLVFSGPRYYDTLPDRIVDDPNGKTLKLRWSEKKQRWQESPAGSYPRVAVFGAWDYSPYLN
jgi:hypothetical protein